MQVVCRLSAIVILYVLTAHQLAAQVVTDGTLGPAQNLTGPDFSIGANLGTRAGDNLFHSFGTFNVNTGQSATFTGPAGLDNVVSRVTGGDISTIDGRLASEIPGADFWLVNPAGVVLGANAEVDVPAGFHVGGAKSIEFSDGSSFSALAAGSTLSVAAPESFGFLSGGVTLNGANLVIDSGGDVTLAGADVNVTGHGQLDVQGDGSQVLRVQGGNVTVDDGLLSSGFRAGSPGTIEIDAAGSVRVTNNGGLVVNTAGAAPAGKISIEAGSVVVDNGGQIYANSQASGSAGTISINAPGDVRVSGGVLATASLGAERVDAGRIEINAGSLSVTDSGWLVADSASGDGGEIAVASGDISINGATVAARSETRNGGSVILRGDSLTLDRSAKVDVSGYNSRFVFLGGGPGVGGRAIVDVSGDVRIASGSQILSKGGDGGGTISVTAGNAIRLFGDPDPDSLSDVLDASPDFFGRGDGGTIALRANAMVADYVRILASGEDVGSGGTLLLDVDGDLRINGSWLEASAGFSLSEEVRTLGSGTTGLIDVRAGGRLSITNDSTFRTQRQANVLSPDPSRVTGIRLTAGDLSIVDSNFSTLASGVFSTGGAESKSDDIILSVAGDALLDDTTLDTNAHEGADSGAIEVHVGGTLTMRNYASLLTRFGGTYRTGSGGDIIITAADLVMNGGAEISTSSLVVPQGAFVPGETGDIFITVSGDVIITNRSNVETSSFNSGDTGDLSLITGGSLILRDSYIQSSSLGPGRGGAVTVRVGGDARLDQGGILAISDEDGGAAGSVAIDVDGRLTIDSGQIGTSTSSITDDAGPTAINAGSLFMEGTAHIQAISISTVAGDVSIVADTIALRDQSFISASADQGFGGRLFIQGGDIDLRDDSYIATAAWGPNPGGDLLIEANRLALAEEAVIFANNFGTGPAGNIAIYVTGLLLVDNTTIATEASQGDGGQISISGPGVLVLRDNSWVVSTVYDSTGDGGDIAIDLGALALMNGTIQANALAGNGGDVTITTDYLLRAPGTANLIEASSELGISGTIDIRTPNIDNLASALAEAPEFGDATQLMVQPCAARITGARGSLVPEGRGGLPASPGVWRLAENSMTSAEGNQMSVRLGVPIYLAEIQGGGACHDR